MGFRGFGISGKQPNSFLVEGAVYGSTMDYKRILQRNIGYGGSHGGQQFFIEGATEEKRIV